MRHSHALYSAPRHRQGGAALMVSLTLLLVVTVTGLAAAGGGTLQLGMAGATKNRNVAFQAAESALREGERRVAALQFACGPDDVLPPDGGAHQVAVTDGGFLRIWDDGAAGIPDPWNADSWAQAAGYSHSLAGVPEAPRYTVAVARVEPDSDVVVFRVTAAASAHAGARAVVESTVRRRFERRIRIRGNAAANVVAIGDGLIAARAGVGAAPDLSISLGDWQPQNCNDAGDKPVTLAYEGTGGTDALVVADLLGLGYAPGMDGLLDVTAQVTGLDRALAEYPIERIELDNAGTTAVAISTLDVSGRFTQDNSYCVNTRSGENDDGTLDSLIAGLLGAIPGLGSTPLGPILQGVAGAGGALVGTDGLLPLLPANASIIVDGGGNDVYDLQSDTETAAFITADLGGDDAYRMRAIGEGFDLMKLPTILDIGGDNSYAVDGGTHVRLSLDTGARSDLGDILDVASLDALFDQPLAQVIDAVGHLGGFIGGVISTALDDLLDVCLLFCSGPDDEEVLEQVLGLTHHLLDGQQHFAPDAAATYQAGRCRSADIQRLSWRERTR